MLLSGMVNIDLVGSASSSQIWEGEDAHFVFDEITRTVPVHPGEDFYIYFDQAERKFYGKPPPPLPEECAKALELVPSWLYWNLTYKFRQLNNDNQITYANLILSSPDEKYVDEIAFCIAHSAVANLQNENFFPELLTHNAELVYENDKFLDYVEIVEKDDHTTVVYMDQYNNKIELPRDLYYWYIVHPKLSDELPTYVDPNYDFTSQPPFNRNYGVPPPVGKYWREWLFNHNDTAADYEGPAKQNPQLKDLLAGVGNLWDAVRACNKWIDNSMAFTSDQERPIQPVRIYRKHIGRCGEYQDMRNAIARAGLIPSTCTLNSAEDHVWNEFWDGRWIHWDGSMDRPNSYDNDLGGYFHKDISSVHNTRGDSHIIPVTPKYSYTCNFTPTVIDSDGLPVDGALVTVETENYYNPELHTTTVWGTTNYTGKVTLPLGNLRNYWVRVESDELGSEPLYTSSNVITNSTAGTNYLHTFQLPLAAESLNARDLDPPLMTDPAFSMQVEYEVIKNVVSVRNPYSSERGDVQSPGGDIDFFISDSTNYNLYLNGLVFNTYNAAVRSPGGAVELDLPDGGPYLAVLSNDFSQSTTKYVRITARIISEVRIDIGTPTSGAEFDIDTPVQLTGTAWAPGGVGGVDVALGDGGEWYPAKDSSGAGEEAYSRWDNTLQTRGLKPGEYTVRARAVSGSRTETAFVNISLVDRTAPEIEITKPDEGSKIELGESFEIRGTVIDNVGIETLEIIVDSDETGRIDITSRLSNDGFYYKLQSYDIGEGDHTIEVRAADGSANIDQDSVSIRIQELEPPELDITAPGSNSIIKRGETVLLRGYAYDNEGLASLEFVIDGDDTLDLLPYLGPDGQFAYDWDTGAGSAVEGPNTLQVVAEDLSGNTNSAELSITLDGTPPSLEITAPSNYHLVNAGDDIMMKGTCGDNVGIFRVELVLDSGPALDITADVAEGSWSYEYGATSRLDPGEHTITISAADTAGFLTSDKIIIIIDAEDPLVHIDAIDGPVPIGDEVVLTGTTSDDIEVARLILSIEGRNPVTITEGLTDGTWEYSFVTSNQDPGRITVTVIAEDTAGNQAADDIRIKLVEYIPDTVGDSSGGEQADSFQVRDLLTSYLFWLLIIFGVALSFAALLSGRKE